MSHRTLFPAILLFISISFPVVPQCDTVYVDKNAVGTGDGSSWIDACTSISAGITVAASGDDLWVKAATYPGRITLKTGVSIYGGFPTSASPEFGDRNPILYQTVIDAGATAPAVTTAAYLSLDGLIIQNAETTTRAAGIYCAYSTVTISNCTIRDCHAYGVEWYPPDMRDGGGIYCDAASPTIYNCTLTENMSGSHGGGIYCNAGSSPLIWNCRITDTLYGGGLGSDASSPQVVNCLIARNEGGGASYLNGSGGSLLNCTIVDNVQAYGAAIYCEYSSVSVTNCIVWNPGREFYCNPAVTYSCVQGGRGGIGNVDEYPMFVDRENGDYRLLDGSPCVDSATTTGAPVDDLDGNPRPGGDGFVDMGAYETPDEYAGGPGIHVPRAIRVMAGAAPGGDGSDWANAFPSLTAALNVATSHDELWVASGTYNETITTETLVNMYAGFLGTETDRSERNWRDNTTTIDAGTLPLPAVTGTNNVSCEGFTITGGTYGVFAVLSSPSFVDCTLTGNRGNGGAYHSSSASTYTNCFITDNQTASDNAGGLTCYGSPGMVITNCFISGNSGRNGGMKVLSSNLDIIGCVIVDNPGGYEGGGLLIERCHPTLENCIISGNIANHGGGISCDTASPTLINTVISFNESRLDDGGGIRCMIYSEPTLVNSILWGNIPDQISLNDPEQDIAIVSYSDVQDGYGGTGNISDDPDFVDSGSHDYHLNLGSPCIDAGNPDPAYNDQCRPPGLATERNDMGAYGGVRNCLSPVDIPGPSPTATPTPTGPTSVNSWWVFR